MFISPLKDQNKLSKQGIQNYQRGKKFIETTSKNLSQYVDQATLSLRSLPGVRGSVFPWNNYDLDYKQLVKNKYHPDKVSHLGKEIQTAAEEKFKALNNAYQQLKKDRDIS